MFSTPTSPMSRRFNAFTETSLVRDYGLPRWACVALDTAERATRAYMEVYPVRNRAAALEAFEHYMYHHISKGAHYRAVSNPVALSKNGIFRATCRNGYLDDMYYAVFDILRGGCPACRGAADYCEHCQSSHGYHFIEY